MYLKTVSYRLELPLKVTNGFKKFDPHVISNNNIIYVSDATDNNIAELENKMGFGDSKNKKK